MCLLLVTTFAHADRTAARRKPAPPKYDSVAGRVVGIEISGPYVVAIVAIGSDMGVPKGAQARFREGKTTKLLPDGDAVVIRVDKRSTIVRTALSPAQVRANRIVQFEPSS
jgi:hypothetical protein